MSVDPVAQINQLLSEGNYQQALQLAQQYGLTQAVQQIQALIYVQQAVNEADNGNVNQALTYLQNAQKLDPSLNLQPYFAYVNVVQLINNANQALQNNDYNSALNYLNQALQIAQQYPDVINVTQIQQEIQVVQALQQIEQYVNNANRELEKANFTQAYQYLQQAVQLAQKYNISAKGLDNATTAVSYLAKIPPFPKAPQGEITLQKVQQYLQALESYFATASQYATEASRYYSGFSKLANRYQRTQQVASQLLSVVNLLVEAQDTVEKNTNSESAVQNAINLVQQAQNQLQNVNADGTPLADLTSSLAGVVQEMYVKYTALLQVLDDIKKSQQEAENGNYSEAVQYLQQAQQIAQQTDFNIDLTPYIQGFSILEGLQPLPQPPSAQTFLSLSQYFNQVYQVLQRNYQVLEKASKYLQINLQAVQGDVQDAKNISEALGLLAEAQQLLNPPQNNTSNGNTISEILANKDKILSDISQALQLLSESQSYDMQNTAKQLFEIAQNFQTQVQTYLAGLEKTQQALYALNTVNQLVTQQVKANSASAYFLALQDNYTEALRVLKNAMSLAMQANSLFEQINATPPFDMNQLQKEDIVLEQSIQLFGTTANVYSAIENALNNQNNLNNPSDYAKYYQNVASTIQKGLQEINSLNITDDGVNQVRQQIVQSLQQMETDYLALSHAFSIIASASTWATVKPERYGNRIAPGESAGGNSPQALAQAYQKASQYLSQYPDLQNIAKQFANLSQFYSLIAQADDLLQQAKASSSISAQISLMEQAKASLRQALQYVSSDSQVYQQIQSEISNIDKAVSVLQQAQSIVQQLNNAINNGDYPSALVYYNELLQVTQGININNVISDVSSNNYFKAIEDVNNNPSLQPQQKQFLNSLIATIGINTYYLPLMQSSLQQAHLQASSWTQALSETFNFTEQMQPVVTNLQNAIQYAIDAQSLAQYVSPQVQQNLSQIVSKLQEQYNAVEEQIQKAQSNGALNVFEGFANAFNTGLNNMMNDINNFIYSHLGQNVWTEILAGIVDGAVFIAISAIPIVGQVFDAMATISFVGSTAFDLLAGPASFNETVNSFKQMFTNPTSLSMIGTLIAGVLARRLIEPGNIESVDLVKTVDSVKSALSKIEDSIKDRAGVSAISDKVLNTVKSDVTKSPDFSKINDLVKEINVERLDIKALKNKDLGNTIVKVEGDAYKFVEIDTSDEKLTVETSYIIDIKNVKLKSFKGVGNIEVKLSKDLTKGTEVNVKPKPISQPTVTLENGNLHFTGEISEETIKNLVSSNDLATALENIRLNLASIVAKQLFDDLQTADGNIVKISPDEGIAYIGGQFYDVLYKDGNIVKMEAIDPLMAQAKLTKFAEDNAGNFVTQNVDLIKQLLENSENLQSIEYYLSNKFAGNVVRNEYLKLKDALGNELEFTSKTKINPGEIETTNVIEGNIPSELAKTIAQKEVSYLTPQEVEELLSFDNRFSRIFRPLIDEHPEVKDLLEKLASQGKLPNVLSQLEEIAGKIKSFYDALDGEVENIMKDIEDELSNKPHLNELFDGVNLSRVVDKIADKIAEKQILNNPDSVLNGEVPEVALSDVLKDLSMSNKAKIVLNYLKTDPKVYNEVMEKLSNFSPEARDYILAQVFDHQFVLAITNAIKGNEDISITPEGLENVVEDIDNTIETIKNEGSQGSQAPVSTSSTSTSSSGTTPTSSTEGTVSNAGSSGTATVLQSSAQQSVQKGAETQVSLFSTLKNALPAMFPDFDKLPSGVKLLFMHLVERLLEEKGEVSPEELQKALENAIEKHQAQLQAIFDSLKKMANDLKAEATSSSEEEAVLNSLDNGIGELMKKVGFDLQRLSHLLAIASFVADRYNVATALELINQLNSLTPQQLQRTIILTQPQIETITNITPLLKELIVKLNKGVKTKDVLDIATQIREALEKMGISLDVEQLIRVINALQTLTQQFKLDIADIATLIAVNDLNGLLAIPVPIISNINSLIASTQLENSTITGNSLSVGTEEIPETTLAVGDIPLQGTTLEQLQQLLQPPPATPPNATVEGNQGGGGVNIPPSYSTPQFASYSSKQQYLII